MHARARERERAHVHARATFENNEKCAPARKEMLEKLSVRPSIRLSGWLVVRLVAVCLPTCANEKDPFANE